MSPKRGEQPRIFCRRHASIRGGWAAVLLASLLLVLGSFPVGAQAPGSELPASGGSRLGNPAPSHDGPHGVPREPVTLTPAQVDQDLVQRIYRESAASAKPAGPTLSGYLADLALRISKTLRGWMMAVLPGLGGILAWLESWGWRWVVLGLALLVAGLLLWRLLKAWAGPGGDGGERDLQPLGASGDGEAGALDWESLLEENLATGRVSAALEALWWWLAERLIPRGAEPSWTSRELVLVAGRRDLLAQVRSLDRMLYGAAPPEVGEVRQLWGQLREAVS